MRLFKTKEEKEEKRIERERRKEEERIAKEEKDYKEKMLNRYYSIVRALFTREVLYVVQDFIVGNLEDYYDLVSYKLDLVIPIYGSFGRITREGILFNMEYVLFVAYSIKTKDGIEEKNNELIHVFNGDNGGYAYLEKDEKKIYEKIMNEVVDESGKSLIEIYSSLLEQDATVNLISQIEEELIQITQIKQKGENAKGIITAIGATVVGASAVSLGHSVRQFGRHFS